MSQMWCCMFGSILHEHPPYLGVVKKPLVITAFHSQAVLKLPAQIWKTWEVWKCHGRFYKESYYNLYFCLWWCVISAKCFWLVCICLCINASPDWSTRRVAALLQSFVITVRNKSKSTSPCSCSLHKQSSLSTTANVTLGNNRRFSMLLK